MNLRFLIPQIITTLILVCAPILSYLIYEDLKIYSFASLILIILTDIIDGEVARKLNVSTIFGRYYDATVDFIIIMFAYYAFAIKNIYPYWLLLLFILFFILTSKESKFVYDPLGKYYGALLFIIIGISIVVSKKHIIFLLIFIVILTIITIISRIYLLKNYKQ